MPLWLPEITFCPKLPELLFFPDVWVRKALQANIEAIQRATKLLEKQSDTLTSVMKQKIRELEESKNSFFRYEGLKLYLFWGGMVCNILVFLMLLYGMISK